MGHIGGDLQVVQVETLEHNTVVRWRGPQTERNLLTGMKTDSRTRDGTTNGALSALHLVLNFCLHIADIEAIFVPAIRTKTSQY
jgi:hypothetical protein